jgi:integrase
MLTSFPDGSKKERANVRGNITRRGKNSWQLKFDVPAIDGKRQTRYATVRGTYQDAQKELTRLLWEADKGHLPDPTNATVGEYLRSWLENAYEQSPKTIERYRELSEWQIIPHLGPLKLQKLKPEAVWQWHSILLTTGLSARTVGQAHRLLRLVLASAVRSGTLTHNVATAQKPPKVEEREIEILSFEQVADVRAKLRGHSLSPIVELALATGMRRGELLGLQWGDIDWDSGTLRVERSLEETKAGLRLKPPKTKRGRRNITLPSETATNATRPQGSANGTAARARLGHRQTRNTCVQHPRGRANASTQFKQGVVASSGCPEAAGSVVPCFPTLACFDADPRRRGRAHC